jgi:phosphatidylinositol kinase/protein kinase (PI-3  family)
MLSAPLRFSFVLITTKGKLLPIPERVPFRLTADMADGLGISGVQGVFQRCAEETLRVLRVGSDVVMTVLEVFKHDPLHSWCAFTLPASPPPLHTLTPIRQDGKRY